VRLRTAIVLTCGLLSLPAAAVALAFSGLLFVAIDNAAAATAAGSTSPYVVTSAQRGDPSAIRHEVACIKAYAADPKNNYTNYAPAIGAPEVTDAIHSGLQPCATFTGTLTGRNQVAQFLSPYVYPGGIQIVVFGGPNQAFLIGGAPATPVAGYTDGPYIARFNPSTGKQVWKTFLPVLSGQWILPPSMAVVKGGWVMAAVGPTIYKLHPQTGAIVRSQEQTLSAGRPVDVNLDGYAVSPDAGGAILMKTQTRSTGCPIQGSNAMSFCIPNFGPQPNSTVIAADPVTLKTIASIQLDQSVTARPTLVSHNGMTYMYLAGATQGIRVIWNPKTKTLTQDPTWTPTYLLPGQGAGDAPVPLGNWVIFNTNAITSTTVPICAVAVSQSNANVWRRACPWGRTLPPGVVSEQPASFSTDPENGMFFIQDWLVGGVFAMHLNQKTGAMKVVWSRPDWRTSDYFSSIGPANHRVVVSQKLQSDFTSANANSGEWQESVLWVDQKTGKTLAQSAINGPSAPAWMIEPGYAGRMYALGTDGTLHLFSVSACTRRSSPPLTPASLTSCPPPPPPSPPRVAG
jgi:hypothetical protein